MTALQDFEAARAVADGHRQQAHRAAGARFIVAREGELAIWRNARETALARLHAARDAVGALVDAGNVLPDTKEARAAGEEYDAAAAEFAALEGTPSDRPLRAQMQREVDEADQQYHADLASLRRDHGIVAVPQPR